MKLSNMLWGIFLVVLGIILGLNALEITNINIFFDGWWTLFIIVPCFIDLFNEKDKTGNLIGLVIGICLLLGCQDFIAFQMIWRLIVPVVLVMIGLSFIFKDSLQNKVRKEIRKLNKSNEDTLEYYATFSGQNLDFSKEKFQGCHLNAVFGGIKCDLREAKLEDKSIVYASSIFGGITIYVPNDVEVKVVSTPIFGGVSQNKRMKQDTKKTLYVNATCVFGGVEIK